MFLRNYDNCLIGMHCFNGTYSSVGNANDSFGDGAYNQRTSTGTNAVVYMTSYCNGAIVRFMVTGICLGDGNTAVTYEDYKLSGKVVENKLVHVSTARKYDTETKKWKMTLIATYSNTGDTDITISEWGLWRNNNSESVSYYSHSNAACVLVFREVLETPIVIEAGTTATLTFTLDVPMPNHP